MKSVNKSSVIKRRSSWLVRSSRLNILVHHYTLKRMVPGSMLGGQKVGTVTVTVALKYDRSLFFGGDIIESSSSLR